MRRPSSYLRRTPGQELKMTPMIDMVFLLLVYFVWTSGFQVAELLLPSAVSQVEAAGAEAAPRERPEITPLVVRLTRAAGRMAWTVDDAPVASLAEVRRTLADVAAIKPDVPVIVHPDGGVPLGDVIDVYDAARQAGLVKIQFAAAAAPAVN